MVLKGGFIDFLINNVGIGGVVLFEIIVFEEYWKMFEINYFGVVCCI